MPKYKYIVKDAQGKTISSETEAYDKNSLIQQLQKQGYFVLSIEEHFLKSDSKKDDKKVSKRKKFSHSKIKLNDLLVFARQLATMLEAGVTLLRSLEVITHQVESERFFNLISKITSKVEQGSSLSEAMAGYPKIFNPFWISLIEVGEASGTMPTVLNKLTFYLEQQAEFRSTIISAIMYPIILFIVCMGAVTFFALVVGPRFENIFNTMNVELPLITRVLLRTFRFIKEKILFLLTCGSISFFFFSKWAQSRSGKYHVEKLIFSLPSFGNIFRMLIIERFSSQMAILVDSGVPILHALDITERLVNNITCATVIKDIKESVRQGELLVAPMKRSEFFPAMAIQMIAVGEETGELSKMLKHVANFYQNTVTTFMKRLGTVIEPFMLVFMGGVIGIIVLAMFLPMFNIAQLGGAKTS